MSGPMPKEDKLDNLVEILPSGKVGRLRTYGLAIIELSLYMATCHVIVLAWTRFEGPPAIFGLTVAFTLFGVNLLTGVYQREVYVTHVKRLLRSGLAHSLSLILLLIYTTSYIQDDGAGFYALGMVLLSYVITNTLRPVLVEVIRAGNENEQRRQPAKTVS